MEISRPLGPDLEWVVFIRVQKVGSTSAEHHLRATLDVEHAQLPSYAGGTCILGRHMLSWGDACLPSSGEERPLEVLGD